MRMGTSEKTGSSSPWLKSDAARGKISSVPLVRVKDMIVPTTTGGMEYSRLSPADRASQKGPTAAGSIIRSLIEGTSVPNSKLLVVDMQVGLANDWGRGVWIMHKEPLLRHSMHACMHTAYTHVDITYHVASSLLFIMPYDTCHMLHATFRYCQEKSRSSQTSDTTGGLPYMRFLGRADTGNSTQVKQNFEKVLIEEWWHEHPDAGPAEPLMKPEQMVEKPSLNLVTFDNGKPIIPDVIKNRFEPEDEFASSWTGMCDDFEKMVEENSNTNTSNSQVCMTGPDFNADPKPIDYSARRIVLEGIKTEDFDTKETCLAGIKIAQQSTHTEHSRQQHASMGGGRSGAQQGSSRRRP